jgi:hypothetical protein
MSSVSNLSSIIFGRVYNFLSWMRYNPYCPFFKTTSLSSLLPMNLLLYIIWLLTIFSASSNVNDSISISFCIGMSAVLEWIQRASSSEPLGREGNYFSSNSILQFSILLFYIAISNYSFYNQ